MSVSEWLSEGQTIHTSSANKDGNMVFILYGISEIGTHSDISDIWSVQDIWLGLK